MIPNILADRYASPQIVSVFDPVNRVRTERQFWLAVLAAQIDAGLDVDRAVLARYEAVLDNIDLESIRQRELVTRHDVKARLDEFCHLAGHQDLHKGMTSRDATENVEQALTMQALDILSGRCTALLALLAELAVTHSNTVVVARTHNVPAQPTTMGKRFAQFGEELLIAAERLDEVRGRIAMRGIKGPVGSQQDQLDLLGSVEAVTAVEASVADQFGFERVLGAVGQVYPRSYDFDVVSAIAQLSAGPANIALQIRLMAGLDLATEGFKPGQVGSSAMPHKMNTRSCERITGLANIIKGHVTMAAALSGDQWNEGDVSCSVVRRVVIPDAFFAIDGLFETSFAVLRDFGLFDAVVEAEVLRYLPFVATPTLLMHGVKQGLGRETAHELIKEHAVATALAMRENKTDGQALFERLGTDDRFPGSAVELQQMTADPAALLGTVDAQIANFAARVGERVAGSPEIASYRGSEIL